MTTAGSTAPTSSPQAVLTSNLLHASSPGAPAPGTLAWLAAVTTRPGGEASPQTMAFQEDVLIVRLTGEVSEATMQQALDMGEELFARHGYILFLVDARHITGMHVDARKLQAERVKQYIRPSHTAMYHVNTLMRVMSRLVQRGVTLVTGRTYPVSFHRDEAEARVEITKQRVSLQRGAPPAA